VVGVMLMGVMSVGIQSPWSKNKNKEELKLELSKYLKEKFYGRCQLNDVPINSALDSSHVLAQALREKVQQKFGSSAEVQSITLTSAPKSSALDASVTRYVAPSSIAMKVDLGNGEIIEVQNKYIARVNAGVHSDCVDSKAINLAWENAGVDSNIFTAEGRHTGDNVVAAALFDFCYRLGEILVAGQAVLPAGQNVESFACFNGNTNNSGTITNPMLLAVGYRPGGGAGDIQVPDRTDDPMHSQDLPGTYDDGSISVIPVGSPSGTVSAGQPPVGDLAQGSQPTDGDQAPTSPNAAMPVDPVSDASEGRDEHAVVLGGDKDAVAYPDSDKDLGKGDQSSKGKGSRPTKS
jgi:hypothetical protein